MSGNYEARVNSAELDENQAEDSYFADLGNFSDVENGNDDEDFLDIYNLRRLCMGLLLVVLDFPYGSGQFLWLLQDV